MKKIVALVLIMALGAGCTTTKAPKKKEENYFNPNGEILVEEILTETILTEEVLH